MALPPAREDRGPRKVGEGAKENEAGEPRAGLSWGRSLETRFGMSQRPEGCIIPCVCGGVRMIRGPRTEAGTGTSMQGWSQPKRRILETGSVSSVPFKWNLSHATCPVPDGLLAGVFLPPACLLSVASLHLDLLS